MTRRPETPARADSIAPRTRHAPRALLLLAAVLSASAGAATPTAPRPALTVTAASASNRDWPAEIEASGAIAAWQEATVAARVAGLPLVEVRADVGDVVRRGQLLARYDDATVRADLARAEAALRRPRPTRSPPPPTATGRSACSRPARSARRSCCRSRPRRPRPPHRWRRRAPASPPRG